MSLKTVLFREFIAISVSDSSSSSCSPSSHFNHALSSSCTFSRFASEVGYLRYFCRFWLTICLAIPYLRAAAAIELYIESSSVRIRTIWLIVKRLALMVLIPPEHSHLFPSILGDNAV